MSEGTAVVVAAVIALVASVTSLILSARAGRKGEEREAHRRLLEPVLLDLGEAIQDGHRLLNRASSEDPCGSGRAPMVDQGNAAADALRTARPRLKYILFGLDDPLRSLTTVPDWTATFKAAESADSFIKKASYLGRLVDRSIARSYARGRPPNALERWRLARANRAMRKSWNERFPNGNVLEENPADDG